MCNTISKYNEKPKLQSAKMVKYKRKAKQKKRVKKNKNKKEIKKNILPWCFTIPFFLFEVCYTVLILSTAHKSQNEILFCVLFGRVYTICTSLVALCSVKFFFFRSSIAHEMHCYLVGFVLYIYEATYSMILQSEELKNKKK